MTKDLNKQLEIMIGLAANGHAGVLDQQGVPYILHPLRVMAGVHTIRQKILAAGHDLIEDTSITTQIMREKGIDDGVINGILTLTRSPEVEYVDYVCNIFHSGDPDVVPVKLSDLTDNAGLERCLLRTHTPNRFDKDVARMRKYLLSYKFLKKYISEEEYRKHME